MKIVGTHSPIGGGISVGRIMLVDTQRTREAPFVRVKPSPEWKPCDRCGTETRARVDDAPLCVACRTVG